MWSVLLWLNNLYTLVSGHFILEAHNLLARKCLFAGSSHQATTFVLLSLQTRTDKSVPCLDHNPGPLLYYPFSLFFVNPLLQPPPMIHEMLSRLDCFHIPSPLHRTRQSKECTFIDVEVQAHGRESRPPL